MGKLQEHIERFERYLNGQMNSSERQEFEQHLADDPKLRLDYESFRQGLHVIKREGLQDEIKDIMQSTSKNNSIHYWVGGVAASIAVVLMIYILKPSDGIDLYMEFYEPYPSILTLRANDNLSTLR